MKTSGGEDCTRGNPQPRKKKKLPTGILVIKKGGKDKTEGHELGITGDGETEKKKFSNAPLQYTQSNTGTNRVPWAPCKEKKKNGGCVEQRLVCTDSK